MPFNENQELQIRTQSPDLTETGGRLWVQIQDGGGIDISFGPPFTYEIGYCVGDTILNVPPISRDQEMVWRIRKFAQTIQLYIGEEIMFDYDVSQSESAECQQSWGGTSDRFRINVYDTVSQFYRLLWFGEDYGKRFNFVV